jgi:hypothetical protein
MVLIVSQLLAAVAASRRRPVFIHVALEAGIGANAASADWAAEGVINPLHRRQDRFCRRPL